MRKYVSIRSLLFFAEAWLLLAAARLILIFVPFRRIAPLLGKNIIGQLPLLQIITTVQVQQNVRIAISRACTRSPWRTKCFEQALAAKIMLRNRSTVSIIYFGVHIKNDDANTMLAHAWLESGGIRVTGGKNIYPFSVIAGFKS
ncbi:Transglutaminase-like superfamily protein [Chitinophaga sp. CF118]|uniref:lasso peptide biosynthesis B2 protein n=1 Tax=Chitinophaga sp. CF118 TaxID=1884367 RepID=UPI0008F00C38|nr:lasso peptide biosynthesis B2 protein [Chitinophaga sp. CF118]SFD79677.1 Transglutaminase-like superfamily protein [Chitinophaga sp. CF118]